MEKNETTSANKRIKATVSQNDDRLTNLPNELLVQILSQLDTKPAVQTCVLSTRYKRVWTSIPNLVFDDLDFRGLKRFYKFVSRVLALRQKNLDLASVVFDQFGHGRTKHATKVFRYALSHNAKHISVSVNVNPYNVALDFPAEVFTSQTLETLRIKISGHTWFIHNYLHSCVLSMAELTYLKLVDVFFSDYGCTLSFAECPKLKCLYLKLCLMPDEFSSNEYKLICPDQLEGITLGLDGLGHRDKFKVVGVRNVVYFCYDGGLPVPLSVDNLLSLEEANINARHINRDPDCWEEDKMLAEEVITVLQVFSNAKVVKLCPTITRILSKVSTSLGELPCPFSNVKILNVANSSYLKPADLRKVTSYLTRSSQGTKIEYPKASSRGYTYEDPSDEEYEDFYDYL